MRFSDFLMEEEFIPEIKHLKDALKYLSKDEVKRFEYKGFEYNTRVRREQTFPKGSKNHMMRVYSTVPANMGAMVVFWVMGEEYSIEIIQHEDYGPKPEIEIIIPKLNLMGTLDEHGLWEYGAPKDKDQIIKYLLKAYKQNNMFLVKPVLSALKASGYDWPELDAIEKSISTIKKRLI